MSKKLLFNSNETSSCYERLVIGYPIQILDEELCEMHNSIILSIKGDEIGTIVELEDGTIVYEIIIYATNSPYVWGKGGRLNADS